MGSTTDYATLFNAGKYSVGTYKSSDKDQAGVVAHVTIDSNKLTVRKVNVYVVTAGGADVANDFSKIAANAVIVYTFDAETGDLAGFAFNK